MHPGHCHICYQFPGICSGIIHLDGLKELTVKPTENIESTLHGHQARRRPKEIDRAKINSNDNV